MIIQFSHSVVSNSLQPHWLQYTRLHCLSVSFPVLHSLPEFVQTHVHWVDDAIQSSHLLSAPFLLPSTFPSIRVFFNESALGIGWSKYWSFNFSISPSNGYSGLISFRIEWFDLLAVQGTLKSVLQHYNSKASFLWCSAFFMVQISHPCMTSVSTAALQIGSWRWEVADICMPMADSYWCMAEINTTVKLLSSI